MDSRKERCKICKEEFTLKEFGYHLRAHKIRVAAYYETYYPKVDLLTGAPINYKERESYFLHDFDTRANLIYYLTHDLTEEKKEYAKKILTRHKRIRGLQFAPSQVELRSSVLPARNYYEKTFGCYASICEAAGLRARFEDFPKIEIPKLPSDFEVWFDTREQTPLSFPYKTKKVKLDFGDYTAAGDYYSGLHIERKAIVDFVSTLSQHYERFIAEIERARAIDCYLVVLVEVSLRDAMHFKIPQSKATPPFIFHRVKELMQKFDNIQFVFANGRQQASQLVTEILLLGELSKNIDLQYHLERNQLCGSPMQART